jgi:UDP-glucose 4-epimerase
MPVLVTGGAGYIGSQTVLELTDAGESIVVLEHLSAGFKAAVSPGAKLVVGDVGNPTLLANVITEHEIDAIIHFAGSIVVPESTRSATIITTPAKRRMLLESAVKGRVPHFIFSSTAAVYGAGGLEPVKENSPLRPQSPYGRSKLMSEWMLDISRAHALKYTVLRFRMKSASRAE